MRRKRRLTPPSVPTAANSLDDVLDEIARLAKISNPAGRAYFCESARLAIEDVRRAPVVKKLQLFRSDKVAARLRAVEQTARTLCEDLKRMNPGNGAVDELVVAGNFLHAAMIDQRLVIKDVIDQLNLLAKVAAAAALDVRTLHDRAMGARAERSKNRSVAGRLPGTPGNIALDIFVKQLLADARSMGGRLTIYKWESPSADEGWGGSLLKAMRLLRPHLPDEFFPMTSLAIALNRIANS